MISVFRVEVAKESLMREIRSVIESGGSYINHRHLALLCDAMAHKGQIMAVTRHGINKTNAGPLMRCSFEQTVDILMDAAVTGEIDDIRGPAFCGGSERGRCCKPACLRFRDGDSRSDPDSGRLI